MTGTNLNVSLVYRHILLCICAESNEAQLNMMCSYGMIVLEFRYSHIIEGLCVKLLSLTMISPHFTLHVALQHTPTIFCPHDKTLHSLVQ